MVGLSLFEGDFSPALSLSSLQLDMLRHPSYQNGKEERRSPMTEEEEAMESQHEMENAITYSSSSSINTNNHISSSDVSTDDKEEEALPQDLSMISNRNVDS